MTATATYPLKYTSNHRFWDSSVVEEVAYDDNTNTLYVLFVNHPDHRAYENVPRHIYDNFVNSYSAGAYYNAWVKNQYRSTVFDSDDLGQREAVVASTDTTGNSTGPHLRFGDLGRVDDTSSDGVDVGNYKVEFKVNGVEGVFNNEAENDAVALRRFRELIGSLGVDYTLVRVSREF